MFNDFEAAAKAMKEQDSRRESIFRQSVEAQKHAGDLLEKKFQEAVKKAKGVSRHRKTDSRFRSGLAIFGEPPQGLRLRLFIDM